MCRSAATKSEELVGLRGIESCPDPTESNSPCSLHKTCNFPMVSELLNLADLFDGHLSSNGQAFASSGRNRKYRDHCRAGLSVNGRAEASLPGSTWQQSRFALACIHRLK